MRPDGLQRRPHRQPADVPLGGRAAAAPRGEGLAGHAGHEPDRRRRQDDPRRAGRRAVAARVHREVRGPLLPRHRPARDPAGGALPARHRSHPGDAGDHREAARARPRVRVGGLGLLPDRDVSGLREALRHRPDAGAPRRPRGRRRVREGGRQGLRPLEGRQAGRAVVGFALGPGAAGLAHRVLGDEHEVPRRALRHPHGRRRQHLPAPRERDRAERGRDRQAVRRHSGSTPST